MISMRAERGTPSPTLTRPESLSFNGLSQNRWEDAMASGDPNYYARRAAQEHAMASAAKDDCARSVHQILANRYEAKAAMRSGGQEKAPARAGR